MASKKSSVRTPIAVSDSWSAPRALLGGLSPDRFMRTVWQRKPLVVRQALAPDALWSPSRSELIDLAQQQGVESRLVQQTPKGWTLRRGPLPRTAIPPWNRPGWTLLVQGMDLHRDDAHRLLRRFDFIPQARLDDVMVSYASDQGGVGPHVDSYDVFLVQIAGRRRWRVSPPGDDRFLAGLPLRILASFEPTQEWVLEPGDLLYLPPGWGHDGVALGGDCMTASIGFRAPTAGELAVALLQYRADEIQEAMEPPEAQDAPDDAQPSATPGGRWAQRLTDRSQRPTSTTGQVPETLASFARKHLLAAFSDDRAIARALGAWVTEPKPQVWFDECDEDPRTLEALFAQEGLRLDRRTRMAYDADHCCINGEVFKASGRDASLLRVLADERRWTANDWNRLGAAARSIIVEWAALGWVHRGGA